MFKPFHRGAGEWCFVDFTRRPHLRYFNGNRSYESIVKRNCKTIAYSGNDFIKHEYYKHFFDSGKDKKWLDIFIGE